MRAEQFTQTVFEGKGDQVRLKNEQELYETDFLIIGGGIGGLQAAITAAGLGLDTLVVEKADTLRSGCGANGNDHFACYIPECHGKNFDFAVREMSYTMEGGLWQDMSMLKTWMSRSFEVVKAWESYGIPMRTDGEWRFEGHTYPGHQSYHLKYEGSNIKKLLTEKAQKSGCRILNKTVVSELLTDGQGMVTGAIGLRIDQEEPVLVQFSAKSVLIATGLVSRLYPGANPAFLFNTSCCPASVGSGHAMAYRAGARLVNLDIPAVHIGPKYFERGGKGSWIGHISDIYGRSIGPYMNRPSRKTGDITPDIWPDIFWEKSKDGSGPVYMNCTNTDPEDLRYMFADFEKDGIDSLADYMRQHQIDLQKEMVEFTYYGMDFAHRGIEISEDASSSLKNLYATGYAVGNINGHSTAAAVFGMIAAEQAAKNNDAIARCQKNNDSRIREKADFYNEILQRGNTGANWKEANGTLQSIMHDYAGYEGRSAAVFTAGVTYVRQLRKMAQAQLGASNAHELMRVLEVLDMIDLAEPIFLMCRNRKESGALYKRVDHPGENEGLKGMYQTVEKQGDEIRLAFRKRR